MAKNYNIKDFVNDYLNEETKAEVLIDCGKRFPLATNLITTIISGSNPAALNAFTQFAKTAPDWLTIRKIESSLKVDFGIGEVKEETEETPAEEPASEEVVLDETPSEFVTSDSTEDIPSEIDNITDETFEATNEASDDLSFDFNKDENLSEPNLDDIEISEEDFDDDLPEEITISKDEDILVESSSSDFMDSVQDSTENYQTEEAMAVEENVIDEATDSFAVDTPTETFESDNFSTVDNVFEEEPSIEETPVEEPETPAEDDMFVNTDSFDDADKTLDETAFDETLVEDPVDSIETEETAVSMDEVEPQPQHESNFAYNDFVSHEEENNRLTDSNIDYLTTEEKEAAQPEENSNAELKKDIKSVLLYMDQLLENLPEEKIVEFAKSEEFTTYKKLFSELGLS